MAKQRKSADSIDQKRKSQEVLGTETETKGADTRRNGVART